MVIEGYRVTSLLKVICIKLQSWGSSDSEGSKTNKQRPAQKSMNLRKKILKE